MKTLKSITLAVLFLFATSFATYANNTKPTNTKDALRTEIVSMIGNEIPVELTTKSIEAQVSFMVNKNNELVVVSVDSSNELLDTFIKSKLNYKKVKAAGTKKGEVYILPLKVNKPA